MLKVWKRSELTEGLLDHREASGNINSKESGWRRDISSISGTPGRTAHTDTPGRFKRHPECHFT